MASARAKEAELKAQGIHDAAISGYSFANDDGQTPKMETARKYVANFDSMKANNVELLIFGDVGSGKTFMAAAIANALISQGRPALVTSFPRLLNRLATFKEDNNSILHSLAKFDLLVIDDLGVERQSDFATEQVYMIIDERLKSRLPIIITTNLAQNEFDSPTNLKLRRIYDRIREVTVPILVTGESRRAKVQREKIKQAAAVLL